MTTCPNCGTTLGVSFAASAASAAVNAKALADTANIVRKLIEEPKPVKELSN